MRRFLALAAFCLSTLDACSEKPPLPYAKAPVATPPSMKAAQASAPPVFIGRWAASREACRDKAWTFTVGGLQAPDVMVCQFDRFNPSSAGYSVQGMCGPTAPTVPSRLLMTMSGAGGDGSLTVEGGGLPGPAPLVRCAAEPEVAAAADQPHG